jgi:CHASE2 domain-containing sensor protein
VLRAQTLRTALAGAAPREASRPLAFVLVTLAAFLALMRDWRMAGVTAVVVAAGAAVAGMACLRAGVFIPLAAPLATLALAVALAGARSWRERRG